MLPVNFHKTFIPERRLLTSLLDYAAQGKQGSLGEMSQETGIPMGKSSGKMPAILDYAQGMGLLEVESEKGSSVKRPCLTAFGEVVHSEDKYLGEVAVQWLAHLNLCRNDIGAKTWHAAFGTGRRTLGSVFTKQQLEDYLISVCGPGKDRTGPLVLSYQDDAAFARAGVLSADGDELNRKKAPVLAAYALPYSAYILGLLEVYFHGQQQVTFSDFNQMTFMFDICFWSQTDAEEVFTELERKRYITIDRQMYPWIIEKNAMADDVWPHIFDDLA